MRLRPLLLLPAVVSALACGSGARNAASTASIGPAPAQARPKPANPRLILATTTSTVDTGLLDSLIPVFEKQSGYSVAPLSLGSGEALATADRGDADVLLVHSPDAEQAFMAAGNGVDRRLVMHNDFIIVGPANDPARIRGTPIAVAAMTRIAAAQAPFVARGDNSGTSALELKLWKLAGIAPAGLPWYIESGTGMGQTLSIAGDKAAYTISDRGTFLAQQSNLRLAVLVEKDPALLNIYHVIRTNPRRNDRMNVEGAIAFADFMVAADTQRLIADYGKDKYGQALFFPDAGRAEDQAGK